MDAPTLDHRIDEAGPAHDALAVLDLLRRFRFLTGRQIGLAVGCEPATLRRLGTAGHVVGFDLVDPFARGEVERVYALARGGAHALVARLGLDRSEVPYLAPGRSRRSLLTLGHTLAVGEFGLALEASCQSAQGLELLAWEMRPDRIGDAVHLYDDRRGAVRVPLVADGFALVRHRGVLHGLLVEIDRGTVGIPRMTLKYRAYVRWWASGEPERKFGVRAIRVLTVAPSDKRVEHLRAAARAAIHRGAGSRLLWFAREYRRWLEDGTLLHATDWRLAHARNGRWYPLFT